MIDCLVILMEPFHSQTAKQINNLLVISNQQNFKSTTTQQLIMYSIIITWTESYCVLCTEIRHNSSYLS